jgi:hypothetical protein
MFPSPMSFQHMVYEVECSYPSWDNSERVICWTTLNLQILSLRICKRAYINFFKYEYTCACLWRHISWTPMYMSHGKYIFIFLYVLSNWFSFSSEHFYFFILLWLLTDLFSIQYSSLNCKGKITSVKVL